MSRDEIQDMIHGAIRQHELRVAAWSGIFGAVLLFGTWHAIWMIR